VEHGQESWKNRGTERGKLHFLFNRSISYHRIVESAAAASGVPIDQLNYEFGRFFVSWCQMSGHEKVLGKSGPRSLPAYSMALNHFQCLIMHTDPACPWGQLHRLLKVDRPIALQAYVYI
jgi:hypothetical protein